MLTQADVTYLGYYDLAANFGGSTDTILTEGGGLTGRYRAGKLRFMSMFFVSGTWRLGEFDLGTSDGQPTVSGGSSGGTLGTGVAGDFTNYWDSIYNGTYPCDAGGSNCHLGVYWEESQQRLWTTFAHDYPQNTLPAIFWADSSNSLSVMTRTLTLGAPGSVSNIKGAWGISGVTDAAQAGGITPIPAWFQSKYTSGKPYMLWGSGYASIGWGRVSPVSLALSAYAMSDPTSIAAGGAISPYSTLADYSVPCANNPSWDWFTNLGGNSCYNGASAPDAFDRQSRNTNVSSDFDLVSGNSFWKNAAPDDALKRCTWGDCINGCIAWVDGPNKQGIVVLLNGAAGNAFYNASEFQSDSANQEFQIFDPNDFGKIANGTLTPWKLKPKSRWLADSSQTGGVTTGWNGTGGAMSMLRGAWYDPTTKLLYAISNGGNYDWQRIFIWSINA